MKKTFITALIFFSTLFGLKAEAASVVIDSSVYNTVTQANGIQRSFLLKIDDGGQYDVVFKPLNDELIGSNGVNIPLNYVYINNNTEDLYMRYMQETFLYKNTEFFDGATKVLTAKVLNYGIVPAGNYTLNTQFTIYQSNTLNQVATGVYDLRFVVLPEQNITFGVEQSTINVTPDKAFNKAGKVYTTTQPTIIVTSNCPWELIADTSSFGDAVGNYYIKVKNATEGVTEKLMTETQISGSTAPIVIARGKGPANGEIITMQYGLESKDGKIIHSGDYSNTIRYTIREYGGYQR